MPKDTMTDAAEWLLESLRKGADTTAPAAALHDHVTRARAAEELDRLTKEQERLDARAADIAARRSELATITGSGRRSRNKKG